MTSDREIAILLHSDPQDHACGLHALPYALELQESEIEVQLIFDGAGTTRVSLLEGPAEKLHRIFEQVRKVVPVRACGFCDEAFRVTEGLPAADTGLS